ncbi:hypothetical protein BpsS36_00062 [Bacillus phage vB_BpsS-36]|uniref:Uncharacterized protein n=1 Tax=Bacillus phage vB_BpsS-36 TaxID=2419622 RepID=A0A3G3BX24_9CAUD|nr:hypothetical protein BpsS36_00062 [Bacillus phage vB_BpsS-36]
MAGKKKVAGALLVALKPTKKKSKRKTAVKLINKSMKWF